MAGPEPVGPVVATSDVREPPPSPDTTRSPRVEPRPKQRSPAARELAPPKRSPSPRHRARPPDTSISAGCDSSTTFPAPAEPAPSDASSPRRRPATHDRKYRNRAEAAPRLGCQRVRNTYSGYAALMTPTPALARLLGASTATYRLALIASPRLLATPCKLTATDGTIPSHVATLIRAIAVRDTASGLAMVLAPTGPALRVAVAARAASDFGDAAIFGAALPDAPTKAKSPDSPRLGVCSARTADATPDNPSPQQRNARSNPHSRSIPHS